MLLSLLGTGSGYSRGCGFEGRNMSGPRKNGNKGQQRTRASSWVGFAFASTQYFRHICLGARTFCYIEKAARNCAKMLILSFFFFSSSVGCSLSQGQKMVKMLHYYFYYLFAFNTSRRGRRRWRWRCRKATTTMARTNVIQSQSGCRLLCILSRFYLCASCS